VVKKAHGIKGDFEWRRLAGALGVLALALTPSLAAAADAAPHVSALQPPPTLQETGLYANFETREVDPNHLAFAPQYPLWTDGASKRRWLSLPTGTAIDGADPDAWIFPVGTRFWKEFSFAGQRVETRYLERLADGRWLYAAYEWTSDGRDAKLAPVRGRRGAYALGTGRSHTIPGVADCKVCHQGGRSEVLGFGALQLSSDVDPGALHAEPRAAPGVDLQYLVREGLLVGFPQDLLKTPPRIAAGSPTERTALGYLHGNCGHCHNSVGSLKDVGLFLQHRLGTAAEPAVATAVRRPVKKPAPGQSPDSVWRIEPHHPERSAIVQRMASRYAALQMPPLGTELVDEEAVSSISNWIANLENPSTSVGE
jgi:hypothetical protein